MRSTPIASGAIWSNRWRLFFVRATAHFVFFPMCNLGTSGYSVLTHEEIVDLLWSDAMRSNPDPEAGPWRSGRDSNPRYRW